MACPASSSIVCLDMAGIALQLFSVVISALVKLALKMTEGVLSKGELMLSQFVVVGVPLLAGVCATDRSSLAAIAALDGPGWICLFTLAFGIYGVANWGQIVATRGLGPSAYSAANSLRLVSACVGSSLALDEPVGGLSWLGVALISAAISGYYFVHHRWPVKSVAANPAPEDSELQLTAESERIEDGGAHAERAVAAAASSSTGQEVAASAAAFTPASTRGMRPSHRLS